MKITANEEYGLRILLRIAVLTRTKAEQEGKDPSDCLNHLASLNDIAQHEGITTDYAMTFITLLRNSNLIESVRGKNGGYKLNRNPEEINLLEVMHALGDTPYNEEFCESHAGKLENCIHADNCSIRSVWSSVANLFNNVLAQVTLLDLLNDEVKLNQKLSTYTNELAEQINSKMSGENSAWRNLA